MEWLKKNIVWIGVIVLLLSSGIFGFYFFGRGYDALKSNNKQLLEYNGKLIESNKQLNSDIERLRENNLQLGRNLDESKKLIESIRAGLIEAKEIIGRAKHQ